METEDVHKIEITNVFINFDKIGNKREIIALRFREVDNILEYSSFRDTEYYSNFENLLLQWMNFQKEGENISKLSEIFYENVFFEQKKLEEVLMVANSNWKFIPKTNMSEKLSKVYI